MQQSISIKNKIKSISVLDYVKILILIFVSISLIANFYPYYEGWDSFVYGISAISLAQGTFGITNELLIDTGNTEFVPTHWVKTVHNNAVPIGRGRGRRRDSTDRAAPCRDRKTDSLPSPAFRIHR